MCGITAVYCPKCQEPETYLRNMRQKIVDMSNKVKHRGPDWSGVYQKHVTEHTGEHTAFSMGHQRLSIIDPFGGAQPIVNDDMALCVNGEIYTHHKIRDKVGDEYKYVTGSDCESIMALYSTLDEPMKLFDHISGQFAFVLIDFGTKQVSEHVWEKPNMLIARDPIGVCPLYYGMTLEGEICVASEMKSIIDYCVQVKEFPPGHYAHLDETGQLIFTQYYQPKWKEIGFRPEKDFENELKALNFMLTRAVSQRLMADVPYGVFLSGGLDSALISSIAMKLIKEKFPGQQLQSFSIGLKDSPDLVAAQKVADFIGTKHYGFEFTFEEGLNAIEDVIEHLETYDVTTVRASTPMYLLSRKVKALGIKMVLSGEGADELLGGYLHFHKAPTPEAFHDECKMRVNNLHLFDCLRANKSTMAWGLEARVPFLDKDVLEQAMPINPAYKCFDKGDGTKIEKYVLRKAFEKDYLPPDLLWRQKEQFSDGVGYSWIDGLKDHAKKHISDQEMAMAAELYPYNTPTTKEAMYYRHIFAKKYSKAQVEKTVARWIPQTNWEGVGSDPSGRAQKVHDEHSNWK